MALMSGHVDQGAGRRVPWLSIDKWQLALDELAVISKYLQLVGNDIGVRGWLRSSRGIMVRGQVFIVERRWTKVVLASTFRIS